MRAIESGYHQLVHELDLSRGARPDGAIRQRITLAARGFQNAIKRDGGARPDLDADARNITVSLADGTFSADKSIDVLRHDARGSVIDARVWDPSSLGGAPIPGVIGTHLDQTNEGDCVGISVVKAFSNTKVGSLLVAGFRHYQGGGARTIRRRTGIVASMRWFCYIMRREPEFYHSEFVRNHDAVGAVTIRHLIPG